MTRFFERLRGRKVDDFLRKVDDLNADVHGGEPTIGYGEIGELPLRSGSVILTDPHDAPYPGVCIRGIRSSTASILGEMWEYPDGGLRVRRLDLVFDGEVTPSETNTVGAVGVESGIILVADGEDLRAHWADEGLDRIGVVSIDRDQRVVRLLRKRFGLKCRQTKPWRAEVIGPVSRELETEIEAYLKTIPDYAAYPFLYFRVETNNGSDRAGHVHAPGQFIPIGNQAQPEMLVCHSGRGDGTYEVTCEFAGGVPVRASITFIDDE